MILQAQFESAGRARARDRERLEIGLSSPTVEGPAIVGNARDLDRAAVTALRGRIEVTLSCGGLSESFTATVSPEPPGAERLVFRKSAAVRSRCFAFAASKSAADFDAALLARLASAGAEALIEIRELGQDRADSGGLFIVGMPIGNQADLGSRALHLLSSVDLILAEDTRIAAAALRWRKVQTPIASCHDHNENQRARELERRLADGERVALISDAGMPLVSDPGYLLVRAAVAANAYVTAVPGPSAPLAALAVSGLPSDTFAFAGFPPRRSGLRERFVKSRLAEPSTTILFEGSSRIEALLAALAAAEPDREVAVCRDLTKMSEQVLRGRAETVWRAVAEQDQRGEYVVVIAPGRKAGPPAAGGDDGALLRKLVAALIEQGCDGKSVVKALQQATTMRRGEAYDLVEGLKRRKDSLPGGALEGDGREPARKPNG